MKLCSSALIFFGVVVSLGEGFSAPSLPTKRSILSNSRNVACFATAKESDNKNGPDLGKLFTSALFVASLSLTSLSPAAAWAAGAADIGASGANAKITSGGASTMQSGRTISITRGVNMDNSDFSNLNLKGVAFQQSIVRDADFRNSNLKGASFFDATVDGSNFENADLTQANFEMAQFNRANLKVRKDSYVAVAVDFLVICVALCFLGANELLLFNAPCYNRMP